MKTLHWKRPPQPSKKARRKFWILTAGIVFLVASFFLLGYYDLNAANEAAEDVLALLRQRVVRYEGYQTNDETKSLIRLLDKTRELSQRLARSSKQNQDFLDEYAYEQRLDGILVLDGKGELVLSTSQTPDNLHTWEELANGENVLAILEHPEKSYLTRDDRSGTEFDVAVVARQGEEPGVIVCYCSKNSVKYNANDITYETLLDNYHFELDGVGGIWNGQTLISSDDAAEEKLNVLIQEMENAKRQDAHCRLLHFWNRNQKWYAATARQGDNYTLYIAFPARKVFQTRNMVTATALFLLMMFWMVYLLADSYAQQENEVRIRKREQAYQEQLRRSAEEAEQASRAKGDFLRQMSHDVRTPINGIRGMIEIGNSFPEDAAKQAECRRKIWEASGFLLDLVNEVLDMSKLESGELVLEEKPFDLTETVESVWDILEGQARSAGIAMENDTQKFEHRYLIGSPLHLRQVLLNIGGNAIKYNKKGGSIRFTVREIASDGETATYEFISSDTGIGMSEEFQKRAFEPFAQENASARTRYQGTGLGLSICRQLVEQMGGSIRMKSRQGEGSTFPITLQFRLDPAHRTGGKWPEAPESESPAGMRVLLAEDNELNMEIAEFLLQREGLTVTRAWDGVEAVRIFEQSAPGSFDVILMDVMMPGMNGLDAARAIRGMTRPDAKTVPIFAMTANAFADDIASSRAAGMNEYLAKPLDMDALRKLLLKYKKGITD